MIISLSPILQPYLLVIFNVITSFYFKTEKLIRHFYLAPLTLGFMFDMHVSLLTHLSIIN